MRNEIWQKGIDMLLDVFPHIQASAKPHTWRRFLDNLPEAAYIGAIEKIITSENLNRATNVIALVLKFGNSGKKSVPDFQYSADELGFSEFYLAQLEQRKGIMSDEQKKEMLTNQKKRHHHLPF